MNFVEAVSFAYQSLRADKLRAGLTMLGMAIGTASIILVVTIALTGRDYILQQIEGVGSNFIYLYYEAAGTVSDPQTLSGYLTLGDLKAVQGLSGMAYAAGIVTNHDRIAIDGRERDITVIGTTADYFKVRNIRILSGRVFDDMDERSFGKVCLLTEELGRKLFGTLEVKGKTIRLFQVRFEVIGIFKEGVDTFGQSEISAYSVLAPLPVMQKLNRLDKLDMIYASTRTNALVPLATQGIKRLLEERHGQGIAYRVENLTEVLRAASRISAALTAVLFLIGAIALIISGIGIMNIMLVTVTERTREIGIKMAIGSRRREILYQFLVESLFLATCGGTLGIILGVSGPLLAKAIIGFDIPISWSSVAVAFMLSFIVGVTFGIIPANRAAKMNPTDALRYE